MEGEDAATWTYNGLSRVRMAYHSLMRFGDLAGMRLKTPPWRRARMRAMQEQAAVKVPPEPSQSSKEPPFPMEHALSPSPPVDMLPPRSPRDSQQMPPTKRRHGDVLHEMPLASAAGAIVHDFVALTPPTPTGDPLGEFTTQANNPFMDIVYKEMDRPDGKMVKTWSLGRHSLSGDRDPVVEKVALMQESSDKFDSVLLFEKSLLTTGPQEFVRAVAAAPRPFNTHFELDPVLEFVSWRFCNSTQEGLDVDAAHFYMHSTEDVVNSIQSLDVTRLDVFNMMAELGCFDAESKVPRLGARTLDALKLDDEPSADLLYMYNRGDVAPFYACPGKIVKEDMGPREVKITAECYFLKAIHRTYDASDANWPRTIFNSALDYKIDVPYNGAALSWSSYNLPSRHSGKFEVYDDDIEIIDTLYMSIPGDYVADTADFSAEEMLRNFRRRIEWPNMFKDSDLLVYQRKMLAFHVIVGAPGQEILLDYTVPAPEIDSFAAVSFIDPALLQNLEELRDPPDSPAGIFMDAVSARRLQPAPSPESDPDYEPEPEPTPSPEPEPEPKRVPRPKTPRAPRPSKMRKEYIRPEADAIGILTARAEEAAIGAHYRGKVPLIATNTPLILVEGEDNVRIDGGKMFVSENKAAHKPRVVHVDALELHLVIDPHDGNSPDDNFGYGDPSTEEPRVEVQAATLTYRWKKNQGRNVVDLASALVESEPLKGSVTQSSGRFLNSMICQIVGRSSNTNPNKIAVFTAVKQVEAKVRELYITAAPPEIWRGAPFESDVDGSPRMPTWQEVYQLACNRSAWPSGDDEHAVRWRARRSSIQYVANVGTSGYRRKTWKAYIVTELLAAAVRALRAEGVGATTKFHFDRDILMEHARNATRMPLDARNSTEVESYVRSCAQWFSDLAVVAPSADEPETAPRPSDEFDPFPGVRTGQD